LGVSDGFAIVREYGIAAEKDNWDFAPLSQNFMDSDSPKKILE